jgi:hypothetical protein
MKLFLQSKTSLLLSFGLLLLCLAYWLTSSAWQHIWQIKPTSPVQSSLEQFQQTRGFRLGYDLYLPNSFGSWTPNADNRMQFNAQSNTYQISNIDISTAQIDDWGARFKIASIDWENEFGLAPSQVTNEQSKFGISQEGSVLHLRHYVDSRDMYFELPNESKARYINVKVKITSEQFHPTALMYIEYH